MIARITKGNCNKSSRSFDRSNLHQIPSVDREILEQTIAEIELISDGQDAKRLRRHNRCLKVTSILFLGLFIIAGLRHYLYTRPLPPVHPMAQSAPLEISKFKAPLAKTTMQQFQRIFLSTYPATQLPETLDQPSLKTVVMGMPQFAVFQKLFTEATLGLGLSRQALGIDEYKFFVETVGKTHLLRSETPSQTPKTPTGAETPKSRLRLCVLLGCFLFAIGTILINVGFNRKLKKQVRRLRRRIEKLLVLQNRRLVRSSALLAMEEDLDVIVVQVFNRIYREESFNTSFII